MKIKRLKSIAATALIVSFAVAVLAAQTATRIRFARGKSATKVSGTVGKYGKREFVIGAKKSQFLTTSVESGCESVTLDVLYKENGESLTGDEVLPEFSNTLPSDGDYIIRVQNSDLPVCKFTLSVAIE